MSSIQREARGDEPRLQGIIDAIRQRVSGVFLALGPILMRSLPIGFRATKWLASSPGDWTGWLFHWTCVVLGIPFCYMVATAVLTPQLFVPPIDAPQSLVKRGYTEQFLAKRITASMDDIGREATVSIPHEVITGNDSQPEIQVPGQELSYTSTVYFLKKVVKRPDVAVHVGITEEGDSYVAHVQVEGGSFDHREGTVKAVSRDDIDSFIRDIGVEAMRLAEPNMLASYLFSSVEKTGCDRDKCDFRQVERIYDEVLRLPVPEQAEWALAGKGLILITQAHWKSAEEQSREALAMHEHSAVLRANLAVALEQQQQYDEALAEFRASAASKSRTAETLRLWGDALMHTGHPERSLEAFRRSGAHAAGFHRQPARLGRGARQARTLRRSDQEALAGSGAQSRPGAVVHRMGARARRQGRPAGRGVQIRAGGRSRSAQPVGARFSRGGAGEGNPRRGRRGQGHRECPPDDTDNVINVSAVPAELE